MGQLPWNTHSMAKTAREALLQQSEKRTNFWKLTSDLHKYTMVYVYVNKHKIQIINEWNYSKGRIWYKYFYNITICDLFVLVNSSNTMLFVTEKKILDWEVGTKNTNVNSHLLTQVQFKISTFVFYFFTPTQQKYEIKTHIHT